MDHTRPSPAPLGARARLLGPLVLLAAAAVPLLAGPAGAAPEETRVIGYSAQGRPIAAYRLGDPAAGTRVIVIGQIHGDEHAGLATARVMAGSAMVAPGTEVWVVPTMNPDGEAAGRRTNGHGVDLNRNFPSGWKRTAAGTTYSGPSAASEPETRAVMAFADAVDPRYLVTVHSPLRAVGLPPQGKDLAFAQRLGSTLGLPVRDLAICSGRCVLGPGPSITSWFNGRHAGTAVTVEYDGWAPPASSVNGAAVGILRAAGVFSGNLINAHWVGLGGATGLLGEQTRPERRVGAGATTEYRGGVVSWTPLTGAHEVYGAVLQAWSATGRETGRLGFPTTGEYGVAGGRAETFQHGVVRWDAVTGRTSVTYR